MARGGGPQGGFALPVPRAPAQKGPLTAMQIRLTVVDPLGPPTALGRAASCDVLVTAPAGTALAAVASALAAVVGGVVGGESGTTAERGGQRAGGERGGREPGAGAVVLYAGAERLDAQRCTLGEPPLLDGAVLSLGAPAEAEPHPELDEAPTQLHVIAGPDAGGVHLLHGGRITVGRSADADVPLDDPDVSRLHCAVTVAPDGRVSVADLGSTNGTVLDGRPIGDRPVRFAPGALLRIGESALRLTPAAGPAARVATAPDGEGHVRVAGGAAGGSGNAGSAAGAASSPGGAGSSGAAGAGASGGAYAGDVHARVPGDAGAGGTGSGADAATAAGTGAAPGRDAGTGAAAGGHGAAGTARTTGAAGAWGAPGPAGTARSAEGREEHGFAGSPAVPAQGRAPRIESHGGDTHAGRLGAGGRADAFADHPDAPAGGDAGVEERGRKGTPLRGTEVPQGLRRRGGLGAWARRLTGGRGESAAARGGTYDDAMPAARGEAPAVYAGPQLPETWPDPAALLLTALGPGPRLWERGPGHPEALAVRLGTADRPAPDGSGRLLPAVPVTVGLREVGALGLAGPRERLSGLARAVLAQLAALHSPETLEIVLISTDRTRAQEERTAEWAWLGWLPHVRPGHGQDCRLLLAHDRDQAAARTDELLRRLDDHLSGVHRPGPARDAPQEQAEGRRPSWVRDEDPAAAEFPGPYTVVVVDGDPGGASVREAVARLAHEGPRAGIHVLCLAEAAPASPASPVTETYDAACAVSPVFRECGAVALLSGDVATALRLMRVARAGTEAYRTGTAPAAHPQEHPESPTPVSPGTVGVVDAVSPAWAERFARALAPLRAADAAGGDRPARVSAPLPLSARLLDELGLARATPASLLARWADAADDTRALGGRAVLILGAGPRGPVCADLVADGPHLLIEGPAGSGRTELLRAAVASLASAERPDRLGIVLVDGRDGVEAGGGPGDGLRVCTDVPHVTTHLTANDPVRMREFAQSLSAELKRRAELLGLSGFAEWHTRREVSGRIVAQRTAPGRTAPGRTPDRARPADQAAGGATAGGGPSGAADPGAPAGAGDLDAPPSSTLRLRPAAARARAAVVPPLPRLVVVVDDLDLLVSPALGSPGRPAAGSVIRALEAVARDGERLGVHLVAATAPGGRTAETEPARRATLRVALDAPAGGRGAAAPLDRDRELRGEPAPGRGRLTGPDGRVTPFQGGRVTGRIPRTATQRPTVVPLEWQRMGDPPARRPVRELGNGPTDLALLASALERAAREVSAAEVPSLL